jgi:hypothetical protein
MTDDPEDQNNDFNDDQGGGGGNRPNIPGGGGGLMALIPLLLTLFRGKGIILLILIAGAAYFFLGRGNCNLESVTKLFSQSGYSYDPAEFNKASVYEGLEDDDNKNPLPEAVSLLKFAPSRGDQGQQGSCVAWSSAYAAQTILTAAATGADPNSIAFSPSYLYNQIRLDDCQGSYVQRAMETMQKNGGVPLNEYPYDDQDCQREPSSTQLQEGRRYAIHGFTRLTEGDNVNQINVRAVKEHLAKDAPVVIGMMVGQSFMQDMMGKELWQPSGMDASQMGMGGHAMCVLGYDDRKFGGAFQIMNSWTPQWGNNGIAWVRYGDFKEYVREAYGIDPLPKSVKVASIPLECTFGLVNNDTKQYIQLRAAGNNTFETVSPITAGTRFKMEVKNTTECYTYIFGQETNGSSYVLFPYTPKYSAYCGITGYRLFPRGQSLTADSIGNRDYIAIVVSKEELDYKKLNDAMSASGQSTYAGKVNEAVQGKAGGPVTFNGNNDGTIHLKTSDTNNKVVATIVAFDKR